MNYIYIDKETDNIEAFCSIRDDIFEQYGGVDHFDPNINKQENQEVVIANGDLTSINLCNRSYSFNREVYNKSLSKAKTLSDNELYNFINAIDLFIEGEEHKVNNDEINMLNNIDLIEKENIELKNRLKAIEQKLGI